MRRRALSAALCLCLLIVALLSVTFTARAEEVGLEEVEKQLEESVSEELDAIDFSELEEWAKQYGANSTFAATVKEAVRSVLNGETSFEPEEFSGLIVNAVTGGIVNALPAFAAIFAVAVMMSMMQGLSSGFLRDNTREIVHFACYAAIIAILAVQITSVIMQVRETVEGMNKLMQAVFPVLLALMTALGSASAAGDRKSVV